MQQAGYSIELCYIEEFHCSIHNGVSHWKTITAICKSFCVQFFGEKQEVMRSDDQVSFVLLRVNQTPYVKVSLDKR